jgi:molybdenum cofactor cytidylyltransferase
VKRIAAVVLAAGLSKRMGQPKMLLPWGKTTVLGQVVAVLAEALKSDSQAGQRMNTDKRITAPEAYTCPTAEVGKWIEIVVVTGGAREAIEAEAAHLAEKFPVRCIHNPAYEAGEMLSSLQCGLAELSPEVESALIGLGDQPQLSLDSAQKVVSAFESSGARLLVPSFNLRRGHPWLVQRDLWSELLALRTPQTLRDFLNSHTEEILYVETDQTILKDLDTPEDYQREKP